MNLDVRANADAGRLDLIRHDLQVPLEQRFVNDHTGRG
jgi:hypothetical protein